MTKSEALNIVFDRLEKVLGAKADEYVGASGDPWRNFNQGGKLQNETAEQTLLGYVDKQIVSLFDAKHLNPERLTDLAFIDEKAGDIAIYMILLMAMVRTKQGEQRDGTRET